MRKPIDTRHETNAIFRMAAVCLTLCVLVFSYSTAQARTLIIECLSEPPLKWWSNDKALGIDVDIMTEVLREMGITDYTFRFVDTGRRLLHNAEQGQSDIVLTLSLNDERERFLTYPEEAHLLLDWRFAIRKEDSNHIRFSDFSDLSNVRIGAAAGYSYTQAFWESGLDIETVARNDLLIPMLLQERFDAVPVNYLSTVFETIQSGERSKIAFLYPPLRRAAYYNPFSKASDYPDKQVFLARYDEIIREMRDDGRLLAIFERYLGPDGLDWWQSQYSQ
ncbi:MULTISPECIES: substrate-binding periplasmic protein [unclassified Thalassospira]|uniref:substrate-binding periplasmic protein n=1 Tax=unclassified Thalassospira TaxID=2648997 RepID=UPI0007AD6CFC|nr:MULTISPECIES: ABC transporter substrate-binding protein [unclassified Thalassospira]KZB59121.1 amino acid ABC transporter substrate-binding protein [Thalassospira sp. MCCC 1A02491]MBO6771365.1 ABC transporter substrate-binding protein [Thalassospira sp.]